MRSELPTGVVSGLIATAPMTAAMELLHRRLPPDEQHPLPPRQITQRLTRKVGVEQELDEPEHRALTLVSHFGYGGAAGGVYALLAERVLPRPKRNDSIPPVARGALQGAGYGVLVWAASYLGLLPAAGLMAPATRHSARRNALMIVAHLIWGATLGALVETFRARGST